MSSKPTTVLNEDQHYFRNKLNIQFNWDVFEKLQCRLPEQLKWKTVIASYHQNKTNGGPNVKYVSSDGHFEAVYSARNVLQTEYNNAADMGTYNYYGPNDPLNHDKYDIEPYAVYGNTPEDGVRKRQEIFDRWEEKHLGEL